MKNSMLIFLLLTGFSANAIENAFQCLEPESQDIGELGQVNSDFPGCFHQINTAKLRSNANIAIKSKNIPLVSVYLVRSQKYIILNSRGSLDDTAIGFCCCSCFSIPFGACFITNAYLKWQNANKLNDTYNLCYKFLIDELGQDKAFILRKALEDPQNEFLSDLTMVNDKLDMLGITKKSNNPS